MSNESGASTMKIGSIVNAVYMVCELPQIISTTRQSTLRIACLESWMINVRALIEFFGLRPASNDSDYKASDYGWQSGIEKRTKAHFEEFWKTASTHVAHLSSDRSIPLTPHNADFEAQKYMHDETALLKPIIENFLTFLDNQPEPKEKFLIDSLTIALNSKISTL